MFCELVRYDMGIIPLNEVHVMWTRLTSFELSIQQEFDIILNCYKEVNIAGKVTTKSKL